MWEGKRVCTNVNMEHANASWVKLWHSVLDAPILHQGCTFHMKVTISHKAEMTFNQEIKACSCKTVLQGRIQSTPK